MGCNFQCWCASLPEELNSSEMIVKERRVESEIDRTSAANDLETIPVCLTVPEMRDSSQKLDISTANSLQVPLSESIDDSQILHEGPLLKYRPGISRNWIKRWCQITPKQFLCFKSMESALLKKKPLITVNLQDITRVEEVDTDIFELFLKNEDPMLKVSREIQQETIDKSVLQRTYSYHYKSSVEPGKLMKRPLRGFEHSMTKLHKQSSWGFREIEWFSSEKRLLFSSEDLYIWISLFESYK